MGTKTNTLDRLKPRIASGLAAGLMAVTAIVPVLGMAGGMTVAAHAVETLEICEVELTDLYDDGVELTWNAIEGAESYEIYRKTNVSSSRKALPVGAAILLLSSKEDEGYQKIAVADNTEVSWVDETVATNTVYTYYVQPVSETDTWSHEGATITHMGTTLHIVSMIAGIVAAVMIPGGFIICLIGASRDDADYRLEHTLLRVGFAFIAFGVAIFLLI